MPAAARLNDPDTGGGQVNSSYATTVFINGKNAATVGTIDTGHGPAPHTPNPIIQGSSTVNIENKSAARVGDP